MFKLTDENLVRIFYTRPVTKEFPQIYAYKQRIEVLSSRKCCNNPLKDEVFGQFRGFLRSMPEKQSNKLKSLLNLPDGTQFEGE